MQEPIISTAKAQRARDRERFRALPIGAEFDFIDDARRHEASFLDRCRKISSRRYQSIASGWIYRVRTIYARVFHIASPGEASEG